jgi:hypothetical protein
MVGIEGDGPVVRRQRSVEAPGQCENLGLQEPVMIDRRDVVRWPYVECVAEGPAGVGKIPSTAEIVAAARTLG